MRGKRAPYKISTPNVTETRFPALWDLNGFILSVCPNVFIRRKIRERRPRIIPRKSGKNPAPGFSKLPRGR
jgi:hypothetical protein